MFLRRETLDKTGLLDEDFFMYGEDIDLSYRITQAGFHNYYYPGTTIIHYKGESTKKPGRWCPKYGVAGSPWRAQRQDNHQKAVIAPATAAAPPSMTAATRADPVNSAVVSGLATRPGRNLNGRRYKVAGFPIKLAVATSRFSNLTLTPTAYFIAIW